MYILLYVLRFGVAWNDLLTEAYKLKKTVISYEDENFESSLLLMDNVDCEQIRAKVQELEEIQARLTELHNCHEESVGR